jgi:hypothetical protein
MWCFEDCMDLKIHKTIVISFFFCKTNNIFFDYDFNGELILLTECVKDLYIMMDSKLRFHQHIN